MQEVEGSRQATEVLEVYRQAYRARYKTPPLHPNLAADMSVLRDVIRLAGFERAKQIVRHYLTMPGGKEWFIQCGHTLEVLRNSLNQINANLGSGATGGGGWNPRIVIDTRCPRCNCDFKLTGDADAVCRDAYIRPCPACEELLAGSAL